MAESELPSPELLRKLLDYDPETGGLTWRPREETSFSSRARSKIWHTRYAGRSAFATPSGHGYLQGSLAKRKYFAHRIAWAVYHGEWPQGEVDHINHDRSDNRISNLRVVDRISNMRNTKRRSDNVSGRTGIIYIPHKRRWRAEIGLEGKTQHLGVFKTFEGAMSARMKAERELLFHENHGR